MAASHVNHPVGVHHELEVVHRSLGVGWSIPRNLGEFGQIGIERLLR